MIHLNLIDNISKFCNLLFLLEGKGWLVEPVWITIGSGMNPVTKMLTTSTNLWCVSGSQVKVYQSSTSIGDTGGMLELVHSLPVSGVCTLAATPTQDSVWIAQASSVIKCYSSTTFEIIFSMDVGPEVTKILSGKYLKFSVNKLINSQINFLFK